MKPIVGLWYYCYLNFCSHQFVEACSVFPYYACCSTTATFLNQSYIPYFETTMGPTGGKNVTLPRSLQILCFGDSLTAGYTSYGGEHYPYADSLRKGLEHMFSSSNVKVEVAGLSGDQVQGQYLQRIQEKCPTDKGRLYDWILIMGGTNDLGWGQTPEVIYEGLSKCSYARSSEDSSTRIGLKSLTSYTVCS
jgi:lysophospholipase L1-like esterase